MKIVLLGYMGSGKTSVGKKLAVATGLPFIDSDAYIEEKSKKTISEIFNKKGESFFRMEEHKFLKELLEKQNDFILSLGGGTPCYADNMRLINNYGNCISIYLRTSISTLVDRLQTQKDTRPLIARLDEELHEFIGKHLFERSFFYEKAQQKIVTDNKTPKELIYEIQLILSK